MSVQQFCLRWNNHQPNFISVCSSLLHNGTLVDVTLAAEGRQLQAHKIVLSACSSYFQALFTANPCQHPIVILKDVQYDDLKTMVDFMYYGEVNVSQEQLPHILKTAEMLKIKGLAEMPTDPANLTKSDSKSSNETTDIGGNGNGGPNGGSGGGAGGLGNSSSGSVNESLWGSTESQFQQQQQAQQQHQQQLQQAQQQHHQHQQQQQQQQHHHHHHQQQQAQQQQQQSTNQGSQLHQQSQHHQLRRTPSPLGAGASPATRRKRLRKSSNNGSGDRNNSEDPHSSMDNVTGNTPGGISLSQMNQMSFGPGSGSLSALAGHTLHAAKLLKEAGSTELEQHPQDSDSLEDAHGHVHMQIKPEVDIGGVPPTMPLDISGATTPSDHEAPNSQPSHPATSPITAKNLSMSDTADTTQISNAINTEGSNNDATVNLQMGLKRNRMLQRQPRVKRDSDSLSNSQTPDPPNISDHFDSFGGQAAVGYPHHSYPHVQHLHSHTQHLLTVPPRIERHSSEPACAVLPPSSTHFLSVPHSAHVLMKQHSDPLLPTQHVSSLSSSTSGGVGSLTNPLAPLHRQYSHPLPSSGGGILPSTPLHHTLQHISLPESVYGSSSPPPAGNSHYLVPHLHHQLMTDSSTTSTATTTIARSVSATSPTKALPKFTTTYIGSVESENIVAPEVTVVTGTTHHNAPNTSGKSVNPKIRSSKSTSGLQSEKHLQPGPSSVTSTSFEHLPTLRIKNEELQRSVSSPQTSREITILDNPRSSHCPVIRPGPALGCNFCWNTIDAHGRILRRKTKYHCPECQTNLCIVPCFQEYHQRINNEATSTAAIISGDNSKYSASSTSASMGSSGGCNANSSKPSSKQDLI